MTPLQIRGACPHDCPDTCGVITTVEGGRAVDFRGDPDHPVTRGWLCAKVRPYLDHVYHPDRLLYPLARVGPKGGGQWRRISWDEAIDDDPLALARDHRPARGRGDPAVQLQRHARAGADDRRVGAVLEPPRGEHARAIASAGRRPRPPSRRRSASATVRRMPT